ncbi:MAG: hypothetical protein WC119_09780 [Synergistaceae bacterium]|jgi:hypothetical protein|nr:hypothetical protein [Candidatus Omnitrophota bacterium]
MTDPINTPDGGNDPETFKSFATKEEHDEYVNGIVQDRLDRYKKKFVDYDDLKTKAEKLVELEKSQMSEVERLKTELSEKDKIIQEKDTVITGFTLKEMKATKLAEAGVAAEWADSVSGNTEEEIEASVARIAARLKVEPSAKTGASSNPANPPSNGILRMTRAELAEKSKDRVWYESNRDAIMKALENGEIK